MEWSCTLVRSVTFLTVYAATHNFFFVLLIINQDRRSRPLELLVNQKYLEM